MLYPHFQNYLRQHTLIKHGDKVVVAVSGGVDSMVLLNLLNRLRKTMRLDIIAAHTNFGLRGKESDRDEAFVIKMCEKQGIELKVHRERPKKGANIQDAAREIRYEFFIRIFKHTNANAIATAHHSVDQAETVIMHMIRGSGLSGLTGMSPVYERHGIRIIRPLLFATREEIETYARREKIRFRRDSTNATKKYTRNAIRLTLLPAMEEISAGSVKNIAAMAERLADEEAALDIVSGEALDQCVSNAGVTTIELSQQTFSALPAAIRRRVLRIAFAKIAGSTKDLNSDQLTKMDSIACAKKSEGTYRLPRCCKFMRVRNALTITKTDSKSDRISQMH